MTIVKVNHILDVSRKLIDSSRKLQSPATTDARGAQLLNIYNNHQRCKPFRTQVFF